MEVKNWRPVVVLNSTCKVLERVMNKQIKTYLEPYNLLSSHQPSYREGKSIHTAWLEVDTWVAKNMEDKRLSGLQLFDMSAAAPFNLCPKETLIMPVMYRGLSQP